MKLSIAEFNVILDTLAGSTQVNDGGMLFHYTLESRNAILKHLSEILSNHFITFGLEEDGDTCSSCLQTSGRHLSSCPAWR
jgi:hypothetical protein